MNEIKRICDEVVKSERVQRISDAKWAGQKHQSHTGLCQFCGNALPFAYRVFTSDGKCHEVTAESPGGARAQGIIDSGKMPEDTHVFALAACEVMCDGELYAAGIQHYEKRSEDWSAKVKFEANQRVKSVETEAAPEGSTWC